MTATTVSSAPDRTRGVPPLDACVAVEPGVPDRVCEFCRAGRYNLCPDVQFMATPPVDGAFTEFVVMPADFVYPLPDHVTLEEGAMIEPLSVGVLRHPWT